MCSSKRVEFEMDKFKYHAAEDKNKLSFKFVVIISIILLIHCDLSNKHPTVYGWKIDSASKNFKR